MKRPYPSYRPSGVAWLGDVPKHWRMLPIRALYARKSERSRPDLPLLSVYRDYGVVPTNSRDDNFNKPSLDLTSYLHIQPSDLVTNKMKTWQGSIAVSDFEGIVSPAYYTFRPMHKEHHRFIHYLLRCDVYVSAYLPLSRGIRVNQWDLEYESFRSLQVLLPPLDEQRTIADFLDRETARIDALIEKKQRQIELLQEKRTALISHAVTKGLNPDAPMKDSGIEWLGQIPAHWEVRRLRYLGSCQNGINIGGEYFGTGYPFVSYGDVFNNRELPRAVHGLVQSSPADRERYTVRAGDVFFTRTSETIEEIGFASVCFQSIRDAVFAGFLIRFRPHRSAPSMAYSCFSFQNTLLRAFFVKEMNLVTRASLSQDLLKQMPVLIPPPEEQAQVASYLVNETGRIGLLIAQIETSTGLLREYRTALISAAVTGKIDVRNGAWIQSEEGRS